MKTLFRPVDNSPLILFRIMFGLLLFLEAWGAILTGWVKEAFITPAYTFPFIDFSWLHPLPGNSMYAYYIVMGIAGIMVMIGYHYRTSLSIYTLMWAGVYFMQKTHYNNHYYLVLLLCILMLLVPAHHYASLDAKRKPSIKSLTCPQWALWIFAAQITIVYTYAAIAKIYPDWLAAQPISIWFAAKSHYPLIGPLLVKSWFQQTVAYGGIAFDLLIAPALIWHKTRKYAFIAAIFFHLFNSLIFQVGVFPYMALGISVFFFNPDTIRRLFFRNKPEANPPSVAHTPKPVLVSLLVVWFIVQLALPLRHWFFQSNPHWTEEGHRLSWRMMLRTKYGQVTFRIKDPETQQEWRISPDQYVTAKQSRAIATRPDMCWQFVQILKQDFAAKGYPQVSIYAEGKVSLNGRLMKPLYDKTVNLATIKWQPFTHAQWLLLLPSE